jgi:peptidyl-prolyl cis-trans isomerase SurA
MKSAFWAILVLLCGFCDAEAKVVDRIYAQVNDDIITLSDINRRVKAIRQELSTKYSGDQLEQAVEQEKANVLDSLIEEKLLVQKAIELGIDSDIEPKVSSAIQRTMKEYNIESMDKFEEILEDQGSSLDEYREMRRNEIMADNIIQIFVASRITMLSSEVEKYYKDHAADFASPEEVSLSEIVVTAEAAGGEENAKKQAADLYNRLKQGASFTSLASQYSKGPTANKGGNIGSNLLAKWHPDIVKAIAGLETGDISEPQKTGEGYVIYRVDERKHSTVPPIDDVRTEIKRRIYMQKYAPEYKRFITRLKDDAYIQIYPEVE